MNSKALQIAIDGPVASGKSTVAKLLADKLDLLYVDTGAMYRAVALAVQQRTQNSLQKGGQTKLPPKGRADKTRKSKNKWIDNTLWNDEAVVDKVASSVSIELKRPMKDQKDDRKVTVLLNGEDVSWEIRTQDMGEGASVVSQYPKVRRILVKKQQQIAKGKQVVMEGRDIGTRVLVNAPLKIFMTADVERRVVWKQKQLKLLGQDLSVSKVKQGLMRRDNREMTRKTDPLRPAKGAWILDTSDLTIDGVVEVIVQRVEDLGLL